MRVECRFESDTLWLSQSLIAQLYGVTPQAITQHIRAIYDENELVESATCKDYLQVRTEGKRLVKRQLSHYSLPVILAVGYRVRFPRGTQFRHWATSTLDNAESITIKAADEMAASEFDRYVDTRRRLKEAEGAQSNIAALRAQLNEKNRD